MKKPQEERVSEFEMLVANVPTFKAIMRYAESLKVVNRLRLDTTVYSIRSKQAFDWQKVIGERRGPLYDAVLRGYNAARVRPDFILGHLNMSIETIGKIIRERKPTTFEELVIWSAIYCDLAHWEETPAGYEIADSVEKYAQWLWRVNEEFAPTGIPFNYIGEGAIVADNVKFVTFTLRRHASES